MVLAPVAGLPPGQEENMQPSESTVLGVASDEPGNVSNLVWHLTYWLRTFPRLVLSWSTEHGFVTSSSQDIEHSPQVDLSPAIVVTLNDADTLNERQGRGNDD